MRHLALLLLRRMLEKTDFAYGSNLVVANCDDGWTSYQAKKKTKENYDLSFLWENTYLPNRAS